MAGYLDKSPTSSVCVAVALYFVFPLVEGAACKTRDVEVFVTAEGCFPQTVQTQTLLCTNARGNNCVTNYTTISKVLQCHDGYQKHNSTVLSYMATPSNFTEECSLISEKRAYSTRTSAGLKAYKYLQPTIVLAGLAGNILSFLVMSSKYMRQFPFSVYLKALAVLDSLVLLHYGMTCADIIKYEDPPFAFRIKGYIACMIYPYLVRVAQLSSAWCVVIFTVDRAVAICDPFFACQNVTISRARTAVAVVVFVLMLSQLYHLILLNLDTDYCHEPFSFPITASEFGAMEMLVLISRIALLLLVPFLTVLCCNLKVIFAVKRSSKIAVLNLQSSIASPKSHNHSRRSDAERKMSIKLFSISITYLLLSLPNAVVILMDLRAITLGDDQWYSQNKNIRFIANMIYSLNFAINYLLYGFAFRKQAVLCMNFKKTSPLTKSMSQRQLPSSKKDSQKTTEAFDY